MKKKNRILSKAKISKEEIYDYNSLTWNIVPVQDVIAAFIHGIEDEKSQASPSQIKTDMRVKEMKQNKDYVAEGKELHL